MTFSAVFLNEILCLARLLASQGRRDEARAMIADTYWFTEGFDTADLKDAKAMLGLECYARYYEHIHGEPVDSGVLIPEILRAFLDADREFQSWSRSGAGDQTRRISTPSTARLAGARGRAGRR